MKSFSTQRANRLQQAVRQGAIEGFIGGVEHGAGQDQHEL